MEFTIIVPVYNEEKTVRAVLKALRRLDFGRHKFSIMVVDDASTDLTLQMLSKERGIKLVKKPINSGKGHSIRLGAGHARGDYIIIQDADLEYDPRELEKLIKPIIEGRASVVYGSRFLGRIAGKRLLLHDIGNKILTAATNFLFGSNITDMETGYKVIPRKFFEEAALRCDRFDIEPEITARLLRNGYGITEIPISYNARPFEEGKKINVLDGLVALYTLFRCRFF